MYQPNPVYQQGAGKDHRGIGQTLNSEQSSRVMWELIGNQLRCLCLKGTIKSDPTPAVCNLHLFLLLIQIHTVLACRGQRLPPCTHKHE